MERFNGTPGPWHVSNEGCMLIRDDNGLSIVAKYVGYTNDDEEVANAHLIAAAPKLLEALQEMVKLNAGMSAIPRYKVISMAESAINKALGGE